MPEDRRLEDPWPGCADTPGGKVPGFPVEAVHFPGGNAGGQTPGGPVARLRGSARGESARIPRGSGSLSRRECRGTAAWRCCGAGRADTPGGEVPGFRGIVVHFPGGNTGGQPPGDAVGPVGLTRQGGSARIPGGNGSLSRRECRGTDAWRCCGAGRADPPGGKCPDSGG